VSILCKRCWRWASWVGIDQTHWSYEVVRIQSFSNHLGTQLASDNEFC
jgi:hypothetical protein